MARNFSKKLATLDRESYVYHLQEDLDEKGKPVKGALEFSIRPMSKKQIANFQDSSSRMNVFNNTILLGNSANDIDLFKSNVIGMKNFIVDGEEYPFKKDGLLVAEEIINILPLDIISEVSKEIQRVSVPTEEDLKK
jgi:hypothetical protein